MQDAITPPNKQAIIKGFFDMFKSYKQQPLWKMNNSQDWQN
jgi:hypothetical protein